MLEIALVSLLTMFVTLSSRIAEGGPGNVDRCFPRMENHTLCYGTAPLNSASTFAALLRNGNSGYSVYQSNIWIILIRTKCHQDLETLLCAIYAPTCLKGHLFTRIYPCQQLCESVKEKCLPRMKVYGFEWPVMVDCGKFPTSQDAECIQLSDKSELSTTLSRIKKQREDRSLNNTILSDEVERKRLKNCNVCHRKPSLEVVTKKFCESSLIIKAKIVQVFNRPKNGISLRLHHRSKILFSRVEVKGPITNLMTDLKCSCTPLTGQFDQVRWLLLGNMENGQFVVKFLTKWRRKHKKFRYLIKSLKSNPRLKCMQQKLFLRSVYKHSRSKRSHERKREQKGKSERYMLSKIIPFDSRLFGD